MPECFAGWMARSHADSGEIFEPKTVKNKIDIASDTRICLPMIIDLIAGEVIWTDIALKKSPLASLVPCLAQEKNPLFLISVDLRFGFMDKSGKVIVKPEFFEARDFSEGLAAIELNEEYGFIDKTGTIVIEPRPYLYLPQFVNGLAQVTTRDFNFGYIDKKGNFVWKSTY